MFFIEIQTVILIFEHVFVQKKKKTYRTIRVGEQKKSGKNILILSSQK